MPKYLLHALIGLSVIGGIGGFAWSKFHIRPVSPIAALVVAEPATPSAVVDVAPVLTALKDVLAEQRKLIVLFADEAKMSQVEQDAARTVGQALFHEGIDRGTRLGKELEALVRKGGSGEIAALEQALSFIESEPGLFDADRLAFREVLRALQVVLAQGGTLPAVKLHQRVGEDLGALEEIAHNYDKEITQIFSRFDTRGIDLKRERWDDYVANLQKLYKREDILKEKGVIVPYPRKDEPAARAGREIFGSELPPKTVMLSFDDGPHREYSDEIAAILKKYGIPAVFFEVGQNLGELDKEGKPHLNWGGTVSRRLIAEGHVIANHSFTHAQLSKQKGDALKNEVLGTDALLRTVDAARSPLFRFPYGARNEEGLTLLDQAQLKSMMWNIDSLDWADPVPNSIADRVLRTLDKEKRGIVLFHDIHERTVKALPLVLDRLVADGYQFAIWNKGEFKVAKAASADAPTPPAITAGDGEAWALVIGIDDYARWPKLQYAARDSDAIRQALIEKFRFTSDHVLVLKNGDATRNAILSAFHDRLSHGALKKNDRLFVFFAGHGATRKLASGRELGYIVPVDSDPEHIDSDGIPMSDIQNIAENLPARHVLFVMDACYSGLGLTRGGGGFLKDNARRIGRQMLTAGGADQLVADGGPNGHSVFTWTLLQALSGKGDLNNDGYITATELAAFIAPSVASISHQTPAFGSLPGSEGGDFVLALAAQDEFLSAGTPQLSGDAITANTKIDAAVKSALPDAGEGQKSAAVVIKDLQGKERSLTPPKAIPQTQRQQAQHANDQGLQFYREKRYAEAEAAFTEALKLRPDFALAANNLGFVFFKQEKFAEAAVWFQNTLKIDPSRAVAWLNLGDALQRSEDLDGARKAWTAFLELAPKHPRAESVRVLLKES